MEGVWTMRKICWKRKKKLSYSQKLLLFVVMSVMTVCSFVFGYFVSNMRLQMSEYVRQDLEHTMNQTVTKIKADLDNLQRIMYTTLMDTHLWRRLGQEYTDPMGTWELYDYVNKYYDTLLSMDDNIVLVTIYVDNPTIVEDKTYIRRFDYFMSLPVYEQVLKANGAVVMYPMTDVFPNDYYTYNRISSKSNFCLLRTSVYRGVRYGVVLEFSRQLFTGHMAELHQNQTYLLDAGGRITLHLDQTVDQSSHVYGDLFDNYDNRVHTQRALPLNWELVVMDQIELMKNVDLTITRMTLYAGAVILLLLLLIIQLLWHMTRRLRGLDATIRASMAEYGGSTGGQEEGADELDQALLSLEALKDRIDYLMNEVMEKELAHRDAELRLLYSQLKPHFLYNTLSCVMSLARRYHDERLENMISSLSDIYRISLNRGKENITVSDELKLTQSYLYIIQNRFDDMLQVKMETDPEIEPSIVPKVILQPFIENCVTHAISGDETLHIFIRGQRIGDNVVFTVQDDGPGIMQDTIDAIFDGGAQGIGFGVRNVHQRIQMLYGASYGVTLANRPEGGTAATLRLPFCLPEQMEEHQKNTSMRIKKNTQAEENNHGNSRIE